MLCALIMAGGKGTRFWPLSTEKKPKQFLKLFGEKTMIQMTVNRIAKLIPKERIFIVTARQYVDLVREQLPDIQDSNIIVEPVGKNTAPCIVLSAFVIKKYYKNATIAVLPSDHLINDENKFINILSAAGKFIDKHEDAIVTLGMKPNRPETGYGYIKCLKARDTIKSIDILKVGGFIEKPDLQKAKEYVDSNQYLWNGGIFIWKAENILRLSKRYIRHTYDVLSKIADAKKENFQSVLNSRYMEVESVSVDYAIMENADKVYVIQSDIGWDDIGNWTSVERYNPKDEEGNVADNNIKIYKSESNIVITKKKTLLNNVKNLIVVETDEYILISSKDNEQEIKVAKELIS